MRVLAVPLARRSGGESTGVAPSLRSTTVAVGRCGAGKRMAEHQRGLVEPPRKLAHDSLRPPYATAMWPFGGVWQAQKRLRGSQLTLTPP